MMKLKLRSEQRLNADGSIWLRYAPLAAGSQFLSVKLNGVHVLGSPLKLDVHAGLMQIHCCEVTGDGASLCHLNERASFRIRAKDGYNNQQPRGGEKFHVALTRADAPAAPPVGPTVRDDNDGSYLVEYTLAKVGMWRLDVRTATPTARPSQRADAARVPARLGAPAELPLRLRAARHARPLRRRLGGRRRAPPDARRGSLPRPRPRVRLEAARPRPTRRQGGQRHAPQHAPPGAARARPR